MLQVLAFGVCLKKKHSGGGVCWIVVLGFFPPIDSLKVLLLLHGIVFY